MRLLGPVSGAGLVALLFSGCGTSKRDLGGSNGGSGGEAGASAGTASGAMVGVAGRAPFGEGGEAGESSVAGAGGEATAATCADRVDLTTDPKNCGRCGHDCLGGGCSLGQCDAIELEKNQGRLFVVAVDKEFVYWGGDGTAISKKKLDGTGLSTELVPAAGSEYAYHWALAGLTLYWGNDWKDLGVRGCALPNCSAGPSTLIAGSSTSEAIAYDSLTKTLFWDQSDGIWHKVLPGGAAENFVPIPSTAIVTHIASDGHFVYWAQYEKGSKLGSIFQSPISAVKVAPLAVNRPPVSALAVYASKLYFAEGSNAADGNVRVVPLPNGAGTMVPPLFAATSGVVDLTADASGVYWTEGKIQSCPLSGCAGPPNTLAVSTQPFHITSDSEAVYWVTQLGQVMKVAK